MTATETVETTHGAICDIRLDRLKKSRRNARKTPHAPADIEALAGSIAAKGMLQMPVVEPEFDEAGAPTGFYLVTIGEGRRQAQLLRAKRKEIKKTEPIRCIIDRTNDAHEISLDENVTRTNMHPADEFEAFDRLARERGLSAEDIGARFGVSAGTVRQRLKLASVSPRLIDLYRAGEMSLEKVMAFTLTDDHDRQVALWDSLSPWDRTAPSIRKHLTRERVSATSRYALFVGVEAYQAAGGVVERDLFAEDAGGYLADPQLLEALVREKLAETATAVKAEGWGWVETALDYPNGHGFRRLYPEVRAFTPEEDAAHTALMETYDIVANSEEPDEADLERLALQIDALDQARVSFTDEEKAGAGVFVCIGPQGGVRIERAFVRPENEAPEEPMAVEEKESETPQPRQPKEASGPPPLSDKLVLDLTAHRTAALRDTLAQKPGIAFVALLHAMVLRTFDVARGTEWSCLEVRLSETALTGYAEVIADSPAQTAIQKRHETWAARLAGGDGTLWETIEGLSAGEDLALLAHCVSLTVNAVEARDRDWTQRRASDDLAGVLALDMTAYWTPTADGYFRRVAKPRILAAVTEAVSEDASRRISGAKKGDMAEAAEALVAGTGWLPEALRTRQAVQEPELLAAA